METLLDSMKNSDLVMLLGGTTIFFSAIFGFIGSIIKDYLTNRQDKHKQIDLELLKSQLANSERLLSNISNAIMNTYISSNNSILEHHQKLWAAMLEIKSSFPPQFFTVYSILSKEEYLDLKTVSPNLFSMIYKYNFAEETNKTHLISRKAEESRPFVDPYLWNVFSVYNAIYGRLIYLAYQHVIRQKGLYWLDDESFIKQVIGLVIPKEKIAELTKNNILAFNNIISYLELEFQKEVQNRLLGRKLTEETVRQAEKISKSIAATIEK